MIVFINRLHQRYHCHDDDHQVFSAIAAIRFIKYLYTKFLYLFGLATNNPAFSESVWRCNCNTFSISTFNTFIISSIIIIAITTS